MVEREADAQMVTREDNLRGNNLITSYDREVFKE